MEPDERRAQEARCEQGLCTHAFERGVLIDELLGPDDGPYPTEQADIIEEMMAAWRNRR